MKLTSVITLSGVLMLSGSVLAQESAHKASEWTPAELQATLSAMPKGDVARGKQLNQDMMLQLSW